MRNPHGDSHGGFPMEIPHGGFPMGNPWRIPMGFPMVVPHRGFPMCNPMETPHGEYPWGLIGNPHATPSESGWKSSQDMRSSHGGQELPVGIPETDLGRAELSHGRFLLDLGISAWVEQALDVAENCSTPCYRPEIRPRQFCPGQIPGLRPGVEQVPVRRWTGSTPAKMLGSKSCLILKFWPAQVLE